MRLRIMALIFVSLSLIPACTSTLLSNERLLSKTADVLGMPKDHLKLVGRISNAGYTCYTVETKNGIQYACTITGGDLSTAGFTGSPTCNR